MKPDVNPYRPHGPIREPDRFYGRSRELRESFNLLRRLENISLVGGRRMGKTSLLYTISHPQLLEAYKLSPAHTIFALIDCTALSDLAQNEIFQHMVTAIRQGLSRAGLAVRLADVPEQGPITHKQLRGALQVAAEAELKVIFVLDQFEGLSQNRNLDLSFYSGLRSFATNRMAAFLTASARSLFDLTYAKNVLGSPFFNIFTTIRLDPFDDDEARLLIEEPSRQAGLIFSDQSVAFILSLAGYHPFNLQLVCFHAFDLQLQKEDLEPADYALLSRRIEPELL